MRKRRRFLVELDEAELDLIREALNSHEDWQLSDPSDRHSGYVAIEDDDPRLPPEIAACRALLYKLEDLAS